MWTCSNSSPTRFPRFTKADWIPGWVSPCTSPADKVATAGGPGDGVVGLVIVDFGVGDNRVVGVGARVEVGVGVRVGAGVGAWASVGLGGIVAGVVSGVARVGARVCAGVGARVGTRFGARVGLGISTAWVHPAAASRTKRPSFRSGFKILFSPKRALIFRIRADSSIQGTTGLKRLC